MDVPNLRYLRICLFYIKESKKKKCFFKQLVKFCMGDFLLTDAMQSGRSVEVNNDQMKALLEIEYN